jgi:hypothetical protein
MTARGVTPRLGPRRRVGEPLLEVTLSRSWTAYRLARTTARWDSRAMATGAENPLLEEFLAAADAVAQARPEVDRDLARELMHEAATMLHNGLALDGLDDHDTRAAVTALSLDLVAEDPEAALRARRRATLEDPGDLHDPDAVSGAYLVAAAILRL